MPNGNSGQGSWGSGNKQSPEAVEFYEFTRTMQSFKSTMADNTTLVLTIDSDLFRFLKVWLRMLMVIRRSVQLTGDNANFYKY
jgi:hypothetical protein